MIDYFDIFSIKISNVATFTKVLDKLSIKIYKFDKNLTVFYWSRSG